MLGMNWDMIGHTWAVNLLRQHVVTGQVRHAYLLTGPDGIGKRGLSLRFSKALNCTNPPFPGEFCSECSTCKRIDQEIYPDLHVIELGQLDELRGSTSSEISIDQILQLQKRLSLTSIEGAWRIGLVLRFWQASVSAANALLKTLEEPSNNVVLILTSRTAEDLLPTIVSRCEVINLRPVPLDEIAARLASEGIDDVKAILLARISGGRPELALGLAQSPDELELRRHMIDEMLEMLGMGRADRFDLVERFRPGSGASLKDVRDDVIVHLELWLTIWRDILLIQLGRSNRIQNEDAAEQLSMVASEVSVDESLHVLGLIDNTMSAITDYANVRLALENLLLAMPELDHKLV